MPGKQVKIVRIVSATEAAWAAGIMDGEGHIGWHFQKPNPKRREINGRYRLTLAVTGTLVSIPERMYHLFGGQIQYRHTTHGTPMAVWSVTQDPAVRALSFMLPYLVAKRELAEELMERRRTQVATRVHWRHRNAG